MQQSESVAGEMAIGGGGGGGGATSNARSPASLHRRGLNSPPMKT